MILSTEFHVFDFLRGASCTLCVEWLHVPIFRIDLECFSD
jgi:hypothetical protein